MPKLILKKGSSTLKKLLVPEQIIAFTVGSEQGNDIVIKDSAISFFHLQIEKQEEEYYVRDLQSQNGTFINGRSVHGRTLLLNRDEVGLGQHQIVFLYPNSDGRSVSVNGNNNNSSNNKNSKENNLTETQRSTPSFEEKVSGVPSLNQLNAWLNDDEVPAKNPVPGENENGTHNLQTPNGIQNDPFDLIIDDNVAEQQLSVPVEAKEPKSDTPAQPVPVSHFFDKPKETKPTFHTTSSGRTTGITPERLTTHCLLGIQGYYLGKKFRIKRPVTRIGRDRKVNDIVIKKSSKGKLDQAVSRRHATITLKEGDYFLSDKRSKSGTWLNQELLKNDQVKIQPGDEIELVSDKKSHIFRFVEEGNWDFSFPKKAGPWHVRHRILLLNLYTAAIVILAGFLFFKSLGIKNTIDQKPNPLMIEESVWTDSNVEPGIRSNTGRELQYFPAIADVNGDDYVDLIYIDKQGVLKCMDGESKAIMWENSDFKMLMSYPITIADLFNNGTPDIVAVSKDMRLRAIDGKWGLEIWKSPILAGPLAGSPIVADFNTDGLKDIAIASSEQAVFIGLSDLKGSRWLKLEIDEPLSGGISLAHFARDRSPKILAGTKAGKVIFINPEQGKVLGKLNFNEELNKATGDFRQNNDLRYPVALADLNGDRVDDFVAISTNGNLIAFNGEDLDRLWYHSAETEPSPGSGINASVILGDLDGDRISDVVSLTPDGTIRAFKGAGLHKDRKQLLWEKRADQPAYFIGYPVLTDFDKNGAMDAVVSDNRGSIHILDGKNGTTLIQSNTGNGTIVGTQLIADLDNDRTLDLLVFREDGFFYKLESNSLALNATTMWGQLFGDSRHSSYVAPNQNNSGVYVERMLIALMLVTAAIGLQLFLRYRRRKLNLS